jgi:peroxiredoxin
LRIAQDLDHQEEMTMLATGASAPDFNLKSHDGEEISLAQYRGKWVVLHTFPLAFTGG